MKLPGFSLLEIMVVMMIIGLMATQVPRLTRLKYTAQEKLIANLNGLLRQASAHAIVSGKLVQLFFDFSTPPGRVLIKEETDQKEGAQQKTVFKPIESAYGTESFEWDSGISIESFIIEGKDEAAGGNLKTVWIYLMPDGIAQQATLRLRDEHAHQLVELQVNPFFAQFKVVR